MAKEVEGGWGGGGGQVITLRSSGTERAEECCCFHLIWKTCCLSGSSQPGDPVKDLLMNFYG